MKKQAISWILAALACLPLSLSAAVWGSPPQDSQRAHFVVYYFHGKFRCATCLKIERLAGQVVREAFVDPITRGLLDWKAVDVDLPDNKHYATEFELSSPTLIVARFESGKVQEFRKLDRVWQFVDADERKFESYVFEEIDRFISK